MSTSLVHVLLKVWARIQEHYALNKQQNEQSRPHSDSCDDLSWQQVRLCLWHICTTIIYYTGGTYTIGTTDRC